MSKREDRNIVQETHDKLKRDLYDAKSNRAEVLDAISRPAVAKKIAKYTSDIDAAKEMLVDAEKPADFNRLQAMVKARRALLGDLKNAYNEDVTEAQRALSEFETANALLIHGGRSDVEAAQLSA